MSQLTYSPAPDAPNVAPATDLLQPLQTASAPTPDNSSPTGVGAGPAIDVMPDAPAQRHSRESGNPVPFRIDFSILDEFQVPTPEDIAQGNIKASLRYTDAHIAQAQRDASILNIPFEDALKYNKTTQQQARIPAYEQLAQYHPRLLQALQGKTAYTARRDVGILDGIARYFDEQAGPDNNTLGTDGVVVGPELRDIPVSLGYRTAARLREGLDQVGDSLRNSFLGFIEAPLAKTRKELEDNPRFYSRYDADVLETDPVYNALSGTAKAMREHGKALEKGRNAPLPEAGNAVIRYYDEVVKMAPQIAAQLGSYFLGGPVTSMGFMASQIMGSSYDSLTKKGVDAETALVSALSNAVLQAPLEQISLAKGLAVLKTSGVWNTAKALFGAGLTEFVTEWMQAYPDAATEIWALTTQNGGSFEDGLKTFIDKLGEITAQGLYEGLVAAPYGLLFGGIGMIKNKGAGPLPTLDDILNSPVFKHNPTLANAVREQYSVAQRLALTDSLASATQGADKSHTYKDNPQGFTEAVREVLPEGFKNTWMGADEVIALYQTAAITGQGQALLEVLGIDEAAIQQAADLGAPVQVDTAAIITMAPDIRRAGVYNVPLSRHSERSEESSVSPDLRARALDALRVTPDGISGTEAKQWNPQERINAAFEAAKTHTQTRSEVNKETTRIRDEIVAAGVEKKTAAQFAALHGANAIAMSTAYGIDPVALLQQRNFTSAEYETDATAGGLAKYGYDFEKGQWETGDWGITIDEIHNTRDRFEEYLKRLGFDTTTTESGVSNSIYLSATIQVDGKEYVLPEIRFSDHTLPIHHTKYQKHEFGEQEFPTDYILRLAIHESGFKNPTGESWLSEKELDEIEKESEFKKRLSDDEQEFLNERVQTLLAKEKDKNYIPSYGQNSIEYLVKEVDKVDGVENYTNLKSGHKLKKTIVESDDFMRVKDSISNIHKGLVLTERGLTANGELIRRSFGNKKKSIYLYQTQADKSGVTTFPDGKRLVTLFTGKWNASTIAHESMHVFLQDLIDIAADNGNGAIDTALRSIAGIVQGANNSLPYQSAKPAIDAAIDRVANASPETRMDALNDAIASLKDNARRVTDTAHTITQSLKDVPGTEQVALICICCCLPSAISHPRGDVVTEVFDFYIRLIGQKALVSWQSSTDFLYLRIYVPAIATPMTDATSCTGSAASSTICAASR